MSETIAVCFDVLYAYAEKNSLDYNDLCRVVRDALARGDQKALPPSVPPGFKLLKDTTHDERSWPEDGADENGNYTNCCCVCLRIFTGHKRRVICRVCKESPPSSVQAVDGDEPVAWLCCGSLFHSYAAIPSELLPPNGSPVPLYIRAAMKDQGQ